MKPPASLWTSRVILWAARASLPEAEKPHPAARGDFHRDQPAQFSLPSSHSLAAFPAPGGGRRGWSSRSARQDPSPLSPSPRRGNPRSPRGYYTHSVARLWKSVSSTPLEPRDKGKKQRERLGKAADRGLRAGNGPARGSATRGSPNRPGSCPRDVTSRLLGSHTLPGRSAVPGSCPGSGDRAAERPRWRREKAELTFRCCRCPAGAGHGTLMSAQGQDARGLWELQSFPSFPSFPELWDPPAPGVPWAPPGRGG